MPSAQQRGLAPREMEQGTASGRSASDLETDEEAPPPPPRSSTAGQLEAPCGWWQRAPGMCLS